MSLSDQALKGTQRNTMEESNKNSLPREYRLRRMVRHLRNQMLRGAAYSLGSGAVSLLILWFEARH
jgi:hypothetical protein